MQDGRSLEALPQGYWGPDENDGTVIGVEPVRAAAPRLAMVAGHALPGSIWKGLAWALVLDLSIVVLAFAVSALTRIL